MKTLLLLSMLALGWGSAEAGDGSVRIWCGVGPAPKGMIAPEPCDVSSGPLHDKADARVQTRCEVRMEEAMRAMEPFIIVGYWPKNQYVYTKEGIAAKYRANELWESTKRYCWKADLVEDPR